MGTGAGKLRVPRYDWKGRPEDYPLNEFPDYEPGKPPRFDRIAGIGWLDEVERVYGHMWGEQGIGRLRRVGVVRPTEHEENSLFIRNPEFFLLRQPLITGSPIDVRPMQIQFDKYVSILKECGVAVDLFDFGDQVPMGAYGPLRKLFVAARMGFVIRGGAIIKRWGHASWNRGLEYYAQKFFTQIGCPILLTVSGKGIFEDAWVWAGEDTLMGSYGIACNEDAMEQLRPVFKAAGVKEVVMAQATTILDSFQSGGEFHTDIVIGIADLGLAMIYPAQLDWSVYMWMKKRGFRFIEIPEDEQVRWAPANGMLLEPGRIVMPSEAKRTNAMLRREGVDVIELDTTGIAQGGVNGIRCITCRLLRDPGPAIEEIRR